MQQTIGAIVKNVPHVNGNAGIHLRQRLLEYAITLSAVLLINFLLPRLLPGDPLHNLVGTGVGTDMVVTLDDQTTKYFEEYYGLNQSSFAQFTLYLGKLLRGDLGYAYYFKAPVAQLIWEHLPWSLLLVTSGMALASCFGILAGAFAAWRRGTAWDYGATFFFFSLRAVPLFFLGILVLIVFSVYYPVFPIFGAYSIENTDKSFLTKGLDVVWHLALPAITLGLAESTGKYALTRAAMLDTLREDYITFCRVRGLDEQRIMLRHALPNALIPVLTHISMRLSMAVGGMIYVETIFGYPGIGKLLYDAVIVRDVQVLQGTFLMISVIVLLLNYLMEILITLLDSRVKG